MAVFVLDKGNKPLMPCSEKRGRKLLASGRARIHRLVPFTIRLVDREAASCAFQPVRIKIDPGSKTTGIALVRESREIDPVSGEIAVAVHVLNLFELVHRGRQISEALTACSAMRCRRRGNLRYRAPRFLNRGNKGQGWLAPSLQHRVDTTLGWVTRLQRVVPVVGITQELVRFDMQALQAEEAGCSIEGIEYQRGTLAGYELGEYLLAKWNRTCAYCGAQNVPFEKEHILAKSRGGSDRVSNLALACRACNQCKGNRDVQDFLAKDPARLKRILAQAKSPFKDAAAVNATRWKLFEALKRTGLPVETGSGGQTKFNRSRLGVPKTHALDAACVGPTASVSGWQKPTLAIQCTGRGSYQRTRLDAYGFPRGYLTRQKRIKGFQTGDMVRSDIPTGKNKGQYVGRVAVRATGYFNVRHGVKLVQGISHRFCRVVQRADGYGYSTVAQSKELRDLGSHKQGTRSVPRSASPT